MIALRRGDALTTAHHSAAREYRALSDTTVSTACTTVAAAYRDADRQPDVAAPEPIEIEPLVRSSCRS